MKIIINKSLLLNSLSVVQKIVNAKSNIPALSGIMFIAKDEQIILVTSNIEQSIKLVVKDDDFKIEREGECLIPGRFFFDVVRKLNGDNIELELEQDNMLRIVSGSSDVTVNLLDVQDYPQPDFDESQEPIVISANLLKEVIRQTTFASSEGATNKPILTGVNFRFAGNKLLAAATDSYRVSIKASQLDSEQQQADLIIPARSLNELAKTISEDCEEVRIYLNKGRVLFVFNDTYFQTRVLEGKYPDATKLIPTNFPTILKYNKLDLQESIDRVSTISNNNTSTTVKLRIGENGAVTLSSSSPELGTIKDVVRPLESIAPNTMSVSFSAEFFSEALRAFSSEDVYVKFSGRPIILESEENPGLVELVLPKDTDKN